MTYSNFRPKKAFLPTMLIGIVAIGACSTTRIEAPNPPAVTVVSPTAWTAPTTAGDIASVATASGQFNTLLGAVNAAGLYSTLTSPGPITVFAPTDAAFAKLPPQTLERLLKVENRDALRQLISYHVVNGRVISADLVNRTSMSQSVAGGNLSIDGRSGVTVNGARVVQADIQASNGVVHAVDTVLMPPNMPTLR